MREAGRARRTRPRVACAREGANGCPSRPASRPEPRTRRAPSARSPWPRGAGPARARTHARTRGRGQARGRLSRLSGAEAQGEVACRGSPGSQRRGGRGRMAEGAQPQQPLQLGPGAAARGMKRESELELPVPGAGGDGAEPGLSKRPRTEEAAADDDGGGMQVTARDGHPVTAGGAARGPGGGEGRGAAARAPAAWSGADSRDPWLGGGRGPVGAWWKGRGAPRGRQGVQEVPGAATRVPVPEWMRGHDAWIGVLGKSDMVEMDSISPTPSLAAWGGVEARRS